MKTAKLIISIIVLFAMIGCGENTQRPKFVPGRFGEPWEIMRINGEAFKKTFDYKKERTFELKFIVTANSVVFDHTGWFTLQLAFRTVEKYVGDPEPFMVGCISYTTRGSYTTQDNILTITRQSTQINYRKYRRFTSVHYACAEMAERGLGYNKTNFL